MKYIFMFAAALFLLTGTVYAAKLTSTVIEIARVKTDYTKIAVYKVVDGKTECYVAFSDYQSNVSPNISCVK